MRLSRTTIFVLACLCAYVETSAQHLEVKGVRKKSKASDCATIVFKSDFDDLKVISMSSDSIYKKKGCEYNNVWTQYVDDSSAPRVPFIALSEYRRFTLRDFS